MQRVLPVRSELVRVWQLHLLLSAVRREQDTVAVADDPEMVVPDSEGRILVPMAERTIVWSTVSFGDHRRTLAASTLERSRSRC